MGTNRIGPPRAGVGYPRNQFSCPRHARGSRSVRTSPPPAALDRRGGGPALSPTSLAPLRQRRTLGAEGGVVAVAGVEPRLVGERAEDLRLDVVDQGPEVVGVTSGVAHAAGEERVAGEQVR